jgi:hypothetical protein
MADELLVIAEAPTAPTIAGAVLVSGRFEGTMSTPRPGTEILELRVDVDNALPNVATGRVSGDLFALNTVNLPGSPPRVWRVYRESWIVDAPTVSVMADAVTITGNVRFWEGTHPTSTVKIVIPIAAGAIGPAQVAFAFQGGTIWRYTCPRSSKAFRDLDLEVDVCQSVNRAPLLPDYDTASHTTAPAGLPRRSLTIERAYAEAGVSVTISPDHTVIDDSDPQFASWSDAELHDALESHFAAAQLQWPRWALWGLLAGTYDQPGVGGIMFDAAAAFGGAGKPPERQGFAVFRNHSWFASLPAGPPANLGEAEALRKYLYTWIHEAGHAFNFLHSWDKNRPDALSWMNYDWRYDNRNGQDAFWKAFLFRFDDEELIHLRHGNRAAVIMGGDPWASGGHAEAPPGAEYLHAAPAAIAQAVGATPVELLLRSKGYYEFMEPVSIEARLRNVLTDVDLRLDTQLQPEFGGAVYFIRRPDGRIVEYSPIACKLAEGQTRALASASTREPGLDRHSESIGLTYGRYGFYFDEPGEYLVRALYQGAGDLLISSNTLRLRIGHPPSAEFDRQAQDFFSYDVGMNLYLGGSSSPYLQRGMDLLRSMTEQYSTSLLGAQLARTIFRAVADPFFRVEAVAGDRNRAVVRQFKRAQPAEALRLTDAAVKVLQASPQKALNLDYGDLARNRAICHAATGDPDAARDELQNLLETLRNRGANPPVLQEIAQYSAKLTGSDTASRRTVKRQSPKRPKVPTRTPRSARNGAGRSNKLRSSKNRTR